MELRHQSTKVIVCTEAKYRGSASTEGVLSAQHEIGAPVVPKNQGHQGLRETVSMELCQRMLGLMAAASQALPLGLLHQRPLQAWFNAFALHPRRDKHRRLRVSRTCWEALRWWKVPSNIRQGVRLGPIFRREVITKICNET
ncbi:UNVERIFIED_CONTAM: hypothetical protein FKN15_004844 [Acipenser sinensis]